MYSHLTSCKVFPFPFQILLTKKQEHGYISSYVHLLSTNPLNMCPHLTSVPKQMGYPVFWLDYTHYRQSRTTLWLGSRSNFCSPEFPGVSSNLSLILIQGQETSLSVNEGMDPCSEWRVGYFCCVTQHYTEESCQRYFISSVR